MNKYEELMMLDRLVVEARALTDFYSKSDNSNYDMYLSKYKRLLLRRDKFIKTLIDEHTEAY